MSNLPPESSIIPIRPENRLRELREAKGEGRVAVAHALGFDSDAQIQRWERGLGDIPTKHARVLAVRYGVSIDWLLGADKGTGEAA